MKKKKIWLIRLLLGTIFCVLVVSTITSLIDLTQTLCPGFTIGALWDLQILQIFYGAVFAASLAFLWLTKKVFRKIPFKKLPELILTFVQLLPELKNRILPILRAAWKKRLSKNRRKK